MTYPPLINYNSEHEYRKHFEKIYCQEPITTFDGIAIRFKKQDFDHAFYESVASKDDTFSWQRAERIDWIKAALEDPNSSRFIGWDNSKKRYDIKRRVALVNGNYVVVIAITGRDKGRFITAYIADTGRTLQMIQQSPPWT